MKQKFGVCPKVPQHQLTADEEVRAEFEANRTYLQSEINELHALERANKNFSHKSKLTAIMENRRLLK